MLADKAKTDTIPTWKAEILRKEHTNAVLDKIRAEIVERAKRTMNDTRAEGLYMALDIIDKYRKEQNNANSN